MIIGLLHAWWKGSWTNKSVAQYCNWGSSHVYIHVHSHGWLLWCFFTASEYLSWVLYLSLPVLVELPEPYFTHYSLLVVAMHILLGQSISLQFLLMAEKYLLRFYQMLSSLYGKSCIAQCRIYRITSNLTDTRKIFWPMSAIIRAHEKSWRSKCPIN